VELEVIVLREIILGHNIAGVPVETDVLHELVVFGAEQEPVLPILLILVGDLLFDLTVNCNTWDSTKLTSG